MTPKPFTQLEHSLECLKKHWPKPIPKEIGNLFEDAFGCVQDLKKKGDGKATAQRFFDVVKLINQLLKTHDLLFLGRKLTYHLVATSDLPKGFGSEEEALAILTELLTLTIKRATFGSKFQIEMKSVQLKEGSAVQLKFVSEGKELQEEDRQKLLEQFYGRASDITFARDAIRRAGGQLWLEFPKETHIALTLNWPAFDVTQVKVATDLETYKLDIWITDYPKLRQRFGIVRAGKLVRHVETFIQALVRHPVDMVIAFPVQGMITTIYESQTGVASSIANRVSSRLKKEIFRLGRKNITPKFRYQLVTLT